MLWIRLVGGSDVGVGFCSRQGRGIGVGVVVSSRALGDGTRMRLLANHWQSGACGCQICASICHTMEVLVGGLLDKMAVFSEVLPLVLGQGYGPKLASGPEAN